MRYGERGFYTVVVVLDGMPEDGLADGAEAVLHGTVIDVRWDEDGEVWRVVVRNDEHLYGIEAAEPEAMGLQVRDLGAVEGVNR